MRNGLAPMIEGLDEGGEGVKKFTIAIKDMAATTQVGSKQALDSMIQFISMGMRDQTAQKLITKNLSVVYEEYATKLGKTAGQLSENEKAQARLNEAMVQAEGLQGVYNTTYENSFKNLGSWKDAITSTQEMLGSYFEPALASVTGSVLEFLQAVRSFVSDSDTGSAMKELAQTIAGAVQYLWREVKVLGQELMIALEPLTGTVDGMSLFRGAVYGVVQALNVVIGGIRLFIAYINMVAEAWAPILKAFNFTNTNLKQTGKSAKEAGKDVENLGNSATGMGNALSSGTSKAQSAMEKLQESIAKANDEFNKQLNAIVKRTGDRIANNKKALEKEEQDYFKSMAKRDEAYAKSIEKTREQNQQREHDLQTSMKKSLVIGSQTYAQDLKKFQEALERERKEGEKRLEEIKKEYEEQTLEAETAYQEKTNALRVQISDDEKMLKDHYDVISTMRVEDSLDEIAQLKKTHAQRLTELQAQTQKEISIGNARNATMGTGYADMTAGMTADWNKSIAEMMNIKPMDWNKFFGWDGFKKSLKDNFKLIGDGFAEMGGLIGSGNWDALGKRFKSNMDLIFGKKQSGGMASGWTMVGDADGAGELIKLPTGSKVFNNNQTNEIMNKEVKLNVTNNYYNTEVSPTRIVGNLMFNLNTIL